MKKLNMNAQKYMLLTASELSQARQMGQQYP